MVRRLAPLLLFATGCIDTQLQAAATEAAVNQDYVDFGTVAVGGEGTAEVAVDSIGRGSVRIVSLTIQGIGGTEAFAAVGDLAGTTLAAGESLALPLSYTPTGVGWDEADLTIQTDANRGDTAFVVALRGRAAIPGLVVSPSSIDFGFVPPGSDPSVEVLVQASGELGGQVAAVAIEGDGAFYVEGSAPVDVLPGEVTRFSVGFGAPDFSEREGVLVLETSDPVLGTVRIPVMGNMCLGDAAEDADGDGVPRCSGDCDDARADVGPHAEETPDGEDDDCDLLVDDNTTAYDDDGDGYSEDAGDCDDADAAVSSAGVETPNGVDDDCDGARDEGTD
ncbi:MAG: choice-of-anchor D domain-containing protein, partial [Myxococcota bacterium]